MMKRFSRPAYRTLLALVLGLDCAQSALAQSLPFKGRWLLDDQPGTQATYTSLTIKDASMSWRGPDKSTPPCTQEFTLKKEAPGTTWVNGRGTKFIAGVTGSLPTYLLQLSANGCAGGAQEVRISYPLVYDTTHIELIDYANGKPVSSRRLHRKK